MSETTFQTISRVNLRRLGVIASVPIALALCSVLFVALQLNPLSVYATIVRGSLGTGYGLSETLVEATPLLLICLGLTIAFRARYWNIGAEGQFIIGAIVVTPLAFALTDLPSYLAVPVLLLASAVAGGGYGAIAGALKARLGVNEIVTTLMMNFVALHLLGLLTWGPLMGEQQKTGQWPLGQPMSDPFPLNSYLLRLFSQPEYRVHVGIVLAMSLLVAVYFFVERTTLGYRIRLMGSNPEAARFAGVSLAYTTLIVSFLSGAFAGLAGATVVLGVSHRLGEHFAPGYGYTGILVTLLGKSNPLGVLLSSLFVAILETGSSFTYRTLGVPIYIVDVILGLIILVTMSIEMIARWRR